ncbi:magnesium/cobalt transporter CorA [Sedimenticola selenatireducens]|uniref:magnesium/cobalt transporter CorA n=1 Tax=Sedimenticola selenatireducens TaxID=191960 RepID=UPI003F4A87D4
MSFFTKRYHPPGTRPGTLRISDKPYPTPPHITLIDYSDTELQETQDTTPEACRAALDRPTTTWIHMQGDADPNALMELGAIFGLHELALEDIVNSGQRPKTELYDEQLFIILSHPLMEDGYAETEQVSLFLGDHVIFSFHGGAHDPFEPVRKRLRKHTGRLRTKGPDYLLYALVDLVIDQSFPVLERFGAELEELEEQLLAAPTRETLRRLHELKRDALLLRRMLWPQREVLNNLMRNEEYPIQEEIRLYFRDCYDHTIQIMDLLETYRDMTTGLLDLYLSSVSNRLNETMRVLTVIATIFIPLTFIAGVYGMNFGNKTDSPWAMPELNWYYGYPLIWGVMLAVGAGLLYLFKRKDWF